MTEQAIRDVLRRYRVQTHYRASRESGASRYAVFGPDGQLTEPTPSAPAQKAREDLTVRDLLELMK